MGASKAARASAPSTGGVGVYRDNPDTDDATSTSSAVLLENIDYPDEELPAYTDEPYLPPASATAHSINIVPPVLLDPAEHSFVPPDLLFSSHDLKYTEYRTRLPIYSTDAEALYHTIDEQAKYPPQYYVELLGTHQETRRSGNKDTKENVTDFYLRINMTNLLIATPPKDTIQLLPDNVRGYRGGRIISMKPSMSSTLEEASDTSTELKKWCEQYVADKSFVKSFTLKREIINHDTKKLEQLLRSAIQETNYRGHLSVNFPQTHTNLIFYSPGWINTMRMTVWVRWVFYLSMLWIITWPILILLTVRYEIVKAVFPYANYPPTDQMYRRPTVMGEEAWFHRWESAIRRAALARMKCKDSDLGEGYRRQTEEADRRGAEGSRSQDRIPSTGNAFADGALGLLAQGARIAGEFQNSGGWGGDC